MSWRSPGTTSAARSSWAAAPARIGAFVRVDALVELGRYDEAERELQAMIDRKPNLAAYARVSYLRELRGDLEGAAEAMRFAVAAGGPARGEPRLRARPAGRAGAAARQAAPRPSARSARRSRWCPASRRPRRASRGSTPASGTWPRPSGGCAASTERLPLPST